MLALALLLLTASPPASPASGETVGAKLARAEAAAKDLELDIARDVLLDVVTDARASEEEQRRAHLLAGEVDRILGKDVDARMHFVWVLQRDPEAQLPPDKPPKITAFFELVRAEVKGRDAPRAAAAPTAAPAPAPLEAVAPADDGAVPLPAVVAGIGAAGALAGVVVAALGENGFAASDSAWTDRSGAQATALVGWSVAAIGTVVAGAGLAVWSTSP